MSYIGVDFTLLPSGKLMESGLMARQRFLMGVSSLTKIDVAPVCAIACNIAKVNALRYCGIGAPNRWCVVAAIVCCMVILPANTFVKSCVQFDVTIVLLSSSFFTGGINNVNGVQRKKQKLNCYIYLLLYI